MIRNYFIQTAFLIAFLVPINSAESSISQRCRDLNKWMEQNNDLSNEPEIFGSSADIPLFIAFPHLSSTIPYLNLAKLPTPIKKLSEVGRIVDHKNLYFKNDANSGELFGGNKLRKLCFLLAWAKLHKAELVITCGGAGSNHTTATIGCSRLVGLPCEAFLSEQRPTSYARRNLILSALYGGKISIYPTFNDRQQAILDRAATCGKKVFYIPGGGSTARGSLGFVNAAFELADQVHEKQIPEPDYLVVGAGSNGTAAGLGLGLCLAGLKTQVVAITTTSMSAADFLEDCKALYTDMLALLEVPAPKIIRYPIYIDSYFGDAYADLTPKTAAALDILNSTEKIRLDGTYAGKAFAAFLDLAEGKEDKDKVLLFWNTFCTSPLEQLGYKILPTGLHHYFTDSLQPGDLGIA